MVSDCGGDALDPASASLFPGSVRWEEGPQGWTQSTRCEEVHTTKQAARPGGEAALAGDAPRHWWPGLWPPLAFPSLGTPCPWWRKAHRQVDPRGPGVHSP